MNLRRWRRILGAILPEAIKRPFRGRIFGYGSTKVATDWSLSTKDGNLELHADGVVAKFPQASRRNLAYHCFENNDSVEEMQGFLRFATTDKGVLLDVGAAEGLFSTMYCCANVQNRAVAIEPSREMYEQLQALVKLNSLESRVTTVNAAVGSSDGEVSGSLNSAGMLIADSSASSPLKVKMICLDDQMDAYGAPTAIKIDVEGFEGEVLKGARRLLEKHKPVLFLEFHLDLLEQKNTRVSDLLQLLSDAGYHFESSLGSQLSASDIAMSPRAIIRFVARAA